MKTLLIASLLLLSCKTIHAQDAHYEFYSPFGSDGTNQPGITPEERNARVFYHVWSFYVLSRKQINRPFPKGSSGAHNPAELDHDITISRYGYLCQSMVELRAFTTQNKGFASDLQKAEIVRIDKVLRSLNLHYYPRCSQGMVDFCAKVGPDQILKALAPVLRNEDGSLRAMPPLD